MIELILIYISLCIVISVVSHITEGFKGTVELNLICTLCAICVVLIPISKEIPELLSNVKMFEIDSEQVSSPVNYDQFKEKITDSIEFSVKDLIEAEFEIEAEVNASLDFADISSIRLKELQIITEKDEYNAQIYKLIKRTYFCEVQINEKQQ